MLEFINKLLSLNIALAGKAKGISLYNDAMALCSDKKYRDALPLLEEAAELGDVEAMAHLGAMHMLGQGTAESPKKAIPWLERAAQTGHIGAMGTLGMLLATGKGGVTRDMERAVYLMQQAAKNGDEQSSRMLSMIEKGEGMFSAGKRNRTR